MGLAPFNRGMGELLSTDVQGVSVAEAFLAHFQVSAANATAANAMGIHAAVVDNGTQQVITTNLTQPSVPRNITATAGGTAADIGAIQVIIEGTDYADNLISETLPAFTVGTAGTVTGAKAFKTITQIIIPAHVGIAATTSAGFGEKLGLPFKLAHNTVQEALLNNVKEGTAPAVTTDANNIDGNTFDLNSALSGNVVDVYLLV